MRRIFSLFANFYSSSDLTTDDSQVMALAETSDPHVRCVPSPPSVRLAIADLFDTAAGAGKPKLDRLREHLLAEGRLQEDAALLIIERGEAILRAESNLIDIEAPITGQTKPNEAKLWNIHSNSIFSLR